MDNIDDMDELIKQLEQEVSKQNDLNENNSAQNNNPQIIKVQEVQNQKAQQETNIKFPQMPIQNNQQGLQNQKQQQINQKLQQIEQNEKQQYSQQKQQQQAPQQQQQQPQKQAQPQPQPIQQQQIVNQQNSGTPKIIEQEQIYTIVGNFKSFNLIQLESNFIANTCMKQPSIEGNSQCLNFYKNLRIALQKQLQQLIDFVEQGKLRDDMYGKFIQASFKDQYVLLQKAQAQGDQFFVKRITNRMNVLKAEQTLIQQNQTVNFVQIVQKIKPNIVIPQTSKPIIRKPQQLQDNINLDTIKTDKNAQKHLEENIDQMPVHVKYEALLKRYKEYYNYATYLSKNVKEKRKEDIEQILKLLEKGKKLREFFTEGQNPSIGKFLCEEIKEITLEEFHKMNQQEYKSCKQI